jgi:hypothetical protein
MSMDDWGAIGTVLVAPSFPESQICIVALRVDNALQHYDRHCQGPERTLS